MTTVKQRLDAEQCAGLRARISSRRAGVAPWPCAAPLQSSLLREGAVYRAMPEDSVAKFMLTFVIVCGVAALLYWFLLSLPSIFG